MDEQTSVSINNDGSIVIHDHSGGDIILRPGNEEEFASRFKQLSDMQKNSLAQALIARKQEVPEAVKKLFQAGASQKNVIWGNISNVGSVSIGDKFDIHLHSSPTKLPAELTLNIPKTDPDKLIGRGNDLEELHELLTNEDGVVVNGLGGIGKTALAQAYVGKYSASYKHIAWITQTTDSIVDDVLNTKGLIATLGVDPAGLEPEQLFEKIILKLRSIEEGPSLLVIDNAEQSLSGHRHLLPGQPGWHLFVTSREDLADFYPKRLGFLSPEEAVELFRQHYTLKGLKDAEIRELVDAVDYHTLTIEILAKTAKVQRYSAAKLKQAIEQDLRANVKVGRQTGQVEKIGSYLNTVFNLSELEAAELWLMKQFACLPAEFHPYELVHGLTLTEGSTYSELFAETISGLAQKGWLLYNQETDSYKMHRIIADVVKKQHGIGVHDAGPLIDAVTRKLSIDYIKDNPVEKFFWIPFGKSLLDKFQDDPSEKVGVLLNNLALVLNATGDYKAAKGLLEKAIQSNERNFGPDHPATSINYSNLGTVLENLGDYKEARKLLEKAVQSEEKNFGPDHPRTALRYSNLALILQNLGDHKAAKELLEKAVQSYERNFGPDHPSTSVSYSNLATVLQGLGDNHGAKLLLEKAVSSNEKNFGPDHPGTATAYCNLGT
ncbi:MAG TPA: tetratricopeptide repeat protein, partial [Flavisolibacter sp.]